MIRKFLGMSLDDKKLKVIDQRTEIKMDKFETPEKIE